MYKPSLEQLGPGEVEAGVIRSFLDTLALVLNMTPFSETTVGTSTSGCWLSSTGLAFSSMSLSTTRDTARSTTKNNLCFDPITTNEHSGVA